MSINICTELLEGTEYLFSTKFQTVLKGIR